MPEELTEPVAGSPLPGRQRRPAPPAVPRAVPRAPRDPADRAAGPWPAGPPAAVDRPAGPWPTSPPPPAVVPPTAQEVEPARGGDPFVRIALVLVVLLLATAAGLGAAALVEERPQTWAASATVRLVGGPAPSTATADAVDAGLTRYARQLSGPAFSSEVATQAQLPAGDRRGDVRAVRAGDAQLRLEVQAARPAQAQQLALAAAEAFVVSVVSDQLTSTPAAGDRLGAEVSQPPTAAVRTQPRDRDAALTGGLAAAAVLVLGATAAAVRRLRRS